MATFLRRALTFVLSVGLLPVASAACGGGAQSTAGPLEAGDEDIGNIETGANRPPGLEPGGDYLHETSWQFVGAHCTEGPLDLGELGFDEELRIRKTEGGLVLVRDQTLAAKGCVNTVMQHASPPPSPDSFDWRMVEQTRVVTPATEECRGETDPPRPGEVRMNGQNLEVLVQRSHWCDGFEVRFVYEPLANPLMEGPQVVRHYVGHFNRRDADAIASLFAVGGTLIEPFTNVEEDNLAHGGEEPERIRAWYAMAFGSVEWLVLELLAIEALEGPSEFRADWRYMDSRLAQPVEGKTEFLMAAGQIVQAEFLPFDGEPQVRVAEGEAADGEAADGEEGGDGAAEATETDEAPDQAAEAADGDDAPADEG